MCRVLLPNRMSKVYLLLLHLHQHQQQWLLSIEQAIISESAPSSYHVSGQVKTISQPHKQRATGERGQRAQTSFERRRVWSGRDGKKTFC